MTRVKISVGILVFIISACVFSSVWVNLKCSRLIEASQEVKSLCAQGNISDATEHSKKLDACWDDFRHKASTIVKSDKLSEIDRICSRITPMLESGSDEFYADLTELEALLKNLKTGETPTLTGVF